MNNTIPEGWALREAESLYNRLRVPRVYDRSQVTPTGKYPVIDQSESGCIGYLNTEPEFNCDKELPLTTFANHTCAVRQMDKPFGVIQNVFPLKAQPDVSQEFLFQILRGAIPQDGYKGHYPQLRETQFLTPPLPEQQKIATILSSVDDVIEKTRAQIDKLKDLKTGMMQELLTKGIGSGGVPHTEFKDSPVGRIPLEWKVGGIYDACSEIFLGLTAKVDYVDSGGAYLVRATDISGGVLSFENARKISVDQHKSLTKYRRAKRGDVLVSKSGSLGVCALVDTDTEFSIYESIIVLQPKLDVVDPKFLLWLMRSTETQTRLLGGTVGSTVGHLNLGDFRKLQLPLPPLTEQTRLGEALDSLHEKQCAAQRKLQRVQNLKKALMQDLLTGKVRVNVKTDQRESVVA